MLSRRAASRELAWNGSIWPCREPTGSEGAEVMDPVIMQRDNEHGRVVVPGRRTDDGERCALVVIHERSGDWAFLPHGATQLGVRVSGVNAVTV
ncbi:MAG TPA: hypothetical protein VFQ77_18235, partial [Pseudonocardiaceae bacterium]|nr:hypothetical protein [Pseudonocardiaceae bacterium]